MSLNWAAFDSVMKQAVELFETTTLKLFPTAKAMLLDSGLSEEFIGTAFNLSPSPSMREIDALGPEWFEYSTLIKFTKYRNYPWDFAIMNLPNARSRKTETQKELFTVRGVTFSMSPAERNILILRPEEIFNDTSRLTNLLGTSNDGRFNVLEVIGLYHMLKLNQMPHRFIEEVWRPAIENAIDGEDLRARIKPFTVSIKRWPEFWRARYQVRPSLIAETETCLGYIIKEELGQDHIESIRDTLSVTPVRFAGTKSEFWATVDSIADTWPIHTPKDIDNNTYLNNWNWWTTSGSSPEFRVKTKDGKTLRVNKSALPLVITKQELLASKNDYNRVIQKAEVGKNRIAYSTPTKNTLQEGYLVHKYDLENNPRMFTSLSNQDKLSWSAAIVNSKDKWASSDIEKNDFIHSTYLDTYIMGKLLRPRLNSQEDIDISVEILKRNLTNKVFVRHEMVPEWNNFLVKMRKSGVVLEGSGGIMSGRRWTTLINSFINYLINQIAVRFIIKYMLGEAKTNTFGGDDSIQKVGSLRIGILIYILISAIFLTINPTKSFISSTTAEFFRVQYVIGTGRYGYYSRVVHSIVSNNPVSIQEIDVVTKLKAFWANCQQIIRRSSSSTSQYLWSLVVKYAAVNNANSVIEIAPSNGGCGLSVHGKINLDICTPGIPRFKQVKNKDKYMLNYSWFDECMSVLDPGVPGVRESYMVDMLEGIRDIDNRVEQRALYKGKMRNWAPFIIPQQPSISPLPLKEQLVVTTGPSDSVRITTSVTNYSNRKLKQLFDVKGSYQTFIDVMSRGIFPRFKDKLEYLIGNGTLWLNGSFRNTKSAYALKSILLRSTDIVGSVMSLPPDMNFAPKSIVPATIGFQKVKSPSDFYLMCSTYWAATYLWQTQLSSWAIGW